MKNERNKKIKIKEAIIRHIENNLNNYFIMIVFFLIGIILGVIFLNNTNIEQQNEIKNYVNGFIDKIKGDNVIDSKALLGDTIRNNVIMVIVLWIAGGTVIGMPIVYGTIGVKGFCLSYTIASIVATIGIRKRYHFCISCNTITKHIDNPFHFLFRSKWKKTK